MTNTLLLDMFYLIGLLLIGARFTIELLRQGQAWILGDDAVPRFAPIGVDPVCQRLARTRQDEFKRGW